MAFFTTGESMSYPSHCHFDLTEHLHRQKQFSEKTFGHGARTDGLIDHITKELKEIKDNPLDVYEWVDVILLAFDGAWRAGYSPEEISEAIRDKQAKNECRKWPDWMESDQNKAIEHIKS